MAFEVTTDIPYGNACDVSVSGEKGATVVSFAPDPHGGPEVMWFSFRVKRKGARAKKAGKLNLILKNFANILGGNQAANLRPVVAGRDGVWRRLDAGTPDELADGRVNVVWTIDEPKDFLDVALSYPYGMPQTEALVAETKGFYRADVIGVSQQARAIVRLSNDYGAKDSNRPALYLAARQHSGETPGSWVLDGFLRRLAELGERAPLVWAVPLANIDGVEGGDYGKDNFPYDLNRAWGQVPMRHEVLVIQRDMRRWKARSRPVLGIDFHAPGACETDGVYAYALRPATHFEHFRASRRWGRALGEALGHDYAAKDFVRTAHYASRWETPTFAYFCANGLDVTALSVETPYALSADGKIVLTIERYREIGARMADGVVKSLEK